MAFRGEPAMPESDLIAPIDKADGCVLQKEAQ